MLMRGAFSRATGNAVAGGVGRRLFRGRLRVLAYHEVSSPAAFEDQVRHLVRYYAPVSGRALAAALRGGEELPPNAVWITFDDGHSSVVRHAQPILDRYDVPATLFVCPGLVDTDRPFWWTVVVAALRNGVRPEFDGKRWADARLVTHLKLVPDEKRRAFVAGLATELRQRGRELPGEQVGVADLRVWTAAGHEVGNHTWDHPCLDRCDVDSQRRQLHRADVWFRSHLAEFSPFFAYPNGNWSPAVERELGRLGYTLAVGFDHRLDRLLDPLRISRLRVSADAPPPRFASIVSGWHPAAFSLVGGTSAGTGRLFSRRASVEVGA